MKKILTIEIEINSSRGTPMQLQQKLDDISNSIKQSIECEDSNPDNRVVYNDWDDPQLCEVTFKISEESEVD